jgi:TnpA family transposase
MSQTAIERTAYRQFKRTYTAFELSEIFTPTDDEIWFADDNTRSPQLRFCLLVLLKCFQHLTYFPAVDDVPEVVVAHIRSCLRYSVTEAPFQYEYRRTLYRHRDLIRDHLGIKAYGKAARHEAALAVSEAATRMERPADLINVAIEKLIKEEYELPAFSTLDLLARRVRNLINAGIYARINERLADADRQQLDALLVVAPGDNKTGQSKLKERPGNVTPTHLRTWQEHLAWLESLARTPSLLEGVPLTKVSQWAAEARAPDAQSIASVTAPRRYALLICLIHEEQMAARDALVTMFLRCVSGLHDRGKTALEDLRAEQRHLAESLVTTLDGIACAQLELGEQPDDARLGELVRTHLEVAGGAEVVHANCQALMLYHGGNYLPLLLPLYPTLRSLLFKIVHTLRIHSSSSDDSVERALQFVLAHESRRSKTIEAAISLSFASEDWQRLVYARSDESVAFHRHALELCVFSAVAEELKTGDLWVEGAGEFADLRAQLLPRDVCKAKTEEFCTQIGLPKTAKEFVAHLKDLLTTTAAQVDHDRPANKYLDITDKGEIVLRRRRKAKKPQSVLALEAALLEEMPIRSVLQGLRNVQHWTNFTQFFGPLSGAEPKLTDPIPKYLLTVFGYGTNMGSSQLSRHIKGAMSSQTIGRINSRHITVEGLDRAMRRIVDTYYGCELPHAWGNEKVASADGTMQELRDSNLMSEYHVRYGKFGGIAFHYVSSLYIALLSHFIPCGAWEGIYLIDAYLQNKSLIQPTTLHTDTQGQSGPIWAMAYMLGINLMPRIRNWRGMTMYRPDAEVKYEHIDKLFSGVADWDFIERYWEDLMQVVISVKEGRVLPSTILRKLSNYSRKNKLYQVFKAAGDIVRTIFLLQYISNIEIREIITAETNKVESYNGYCDWVAFAGGGEYAGTDEDSFTKRMKYTDVLADALILHNIVDMTVGLEQLKRRGFVVAPETVAQLSPYITRNWQRFGDYDVDMNEVPPPLDALVRLFSPVTSLVTTGNSS